MGNSSNKKFEYEGAITKEGKIGEDSFKYASVMATGRRKAMEDFIKCEVGFKDMRVVDEIAWFAIFDGHGGARIAEYCSEHMFNRFMNSPPMKKNELTTRNITRGLQDAYLEMDDEVESLRPILVSKASSACVGKRRDTYLSSEYTGTTATTVVVTKDHIVIGHAGDSRAVLVSQGKVKYKTVDHHPDEPGELRRIIESSGTVVNQRINGDLAVSRAIGDFVYKRDLARKISEQWVIPNPVIRSFERSPDDEYMIVASDGLWAVMETDEVTDFIQSRVKRGVPISDCCDELIRECLVSKRTHDNVSIVLIHL